MTSTEVVTAEEGTSPAAPGLADVATLERPRRVILMVMAGAPTDATIDALVPLLEPGDIVVDGGNAHDEDTRRREKALRAEGLHFAGAGISGGEEGALLGPSLMPGGSRASYGALGPPLEDIAAKVDGEPCCKDRPPAALVQGLRERFGAHTSRRIDQHGTSHTLWSRDRTGVKVTG